MTSIERLIRSLTLPPLPHLKSSLRDAVSAPQPDSSSPDSERTTLGEQQEELEQHGHFIVELIISDLICNPSAISADNIKHAKEQLLSDQVLSAISERYALLGKQSAPLTSRDVFQSQGNIHVKLLKTYIGALYRSYKLDLESEYGTAKTGKMIDQIGEWLTPLFEPLLREIQLKKDNEIAAGKDEEDGVTRSTFDLRKMTPKLLDDLRIAQHAHGATARLHEHLIGREGLHCPTYEYTPLLEQLFKVVCKVRDRDGQVLL